MGDATISTKHSSTRLHGTYRPSLSLSLSPSRFHLLPPDPLRLFVRIPWAEETYLFGKHAIDAVRKHSTIVQDVGKSYGMAKDHYVFVTENGTFQSSLCTQHSSLTHVSLGCFAGNVFVCFVHPQNLLPSWAGVTTAGMQAALFDSYAARRNMRQPHSNRPVAPLSLSRWVASQAEGLTEGEKPFERAAQMRRAEIDAGEIVPFASLPTFVRTLLEAAGMGGELWDLDPSEWPHESPLNAFLSLKGQASQANKRKREEQLGLPKFALTNAMRGVRTRRPCERITSGDQARVDWAIQLVSRRSARAKTPWQRMEGRA